MYKLWNDKTMIQFWAVLIQERSLFTSEITIWHKSDFQLFFYENLIVETNRIMCACGSRNQTCKTWSLNKYHKKDPNMYNCLQCGIKSGHMFYCRYILIHSFVVIYTWTCVCTHQASLGSPRVNQQMEICHL